MRTEDLNETLSRLRDWIDNVDQKTSVLIAILAIMLGITIPEIKDTKDILINSGLTAPNAIFLAVWLLYLYNLIFALRQALHALAPHLERVYLQVSSVDGRPTITDWAGIGSLSFEEYTKMVEDTTEEQLRRELIQLCYLYGKGANHKFTFFIKAMSKFRFALLAQLAILAWITIVLPGGV